MNPRILALLLVVAALVSVAVFSLSTPSGPVATEIPTTAIPNNGLVGNTTATAASQNNGTSVAPVADPSATPAISAPAPAEQLSEITQQGNDSITVDPSASAPSPAMMTGPDRAAQPESLPPPN